MAPKAALPSRRSGRISSTLNLGTKVEVRSDQTGFEDAWFEAIITNVLPRRGYEVEYPAFKTEAKRSRPLRETVRASHVRPAASLPRGACHRPDELVDAYWNDAWWRGAVAGVSGDAPAAYVVSFPVSRVEMKFSAGDVRAHQEWADGRWFPSPLEGALYKEEDKVEVSGNKEKYGVVWHPARVTKVIDKTTFVVVYITEENTQREFLDVQFIRPIPSPTLADKTFALLEHVEVYYRSGWRLGKVSEIIDDSNYIVKLKSGQEKQELQLTCDLMRIDHRWIKGRWTYNTEVSGRSFGAGSNRKRGDGPSSEGREQRECDTSETFDVSQVSGRSFGAGSNRKRGDGPSSEGRGQKECDTSETFDVSQVSGQSFGAGSNRKRGDGPSSEGRGQKECDTSETFDVSQVSGRSFGAGSNRKRVDGPSSEGRGPKKCGTSEKLKSKLDPKTPSMETQFQDTASDHEFDLEISEPTLVKIPFATKSEFWVSDEFIQCCRVLPQPQEPNFDKMLEITDEKTVEHMAISQVKNFAQLVTDIKNVHILDKEQPFKDILEVLVELEKYRYNVRCVRSRIEELLKIQNDHRQLHRKKTKLREKGIETYSEYQTLDKTIKEMEKNLADLRRKRTTTRLDLVKLKKDVQAIKEAECSAQQRFDTIRASRVL